MHSSKYIKKIILGTNKTKKRKIYTYSINYQSNILFQRICQESGKCIDRRYSALFLLLVMTRVDNCKLLQILSGMFMTVNTASRACKSIAIRRIVVVFRDDRSSGGRQPLAKGQVLSIGRSTGSFASSQSLSNVAAPLLYTFSFSLIDAK